MAAANAVDTMLDGVTSIELISLYPHSGWDTEEVRQKDTGPRLSRWKISGHAVLADRKKIADLRESLIGGIKGSDGGMMGCFNPRHALKFKNGGEEIVVIVCFECLQGEIKGSKKIGGFRTNNSPEPVFNRIFEDQGLEISR